MAWNFKAAKKQEQPVATKQRVYRNAIASIESRGSGDYKAIGPKNKTLGRPLGRYQVMEGNLPQWSKEAIGREVSADEFLESPEIQDAVFDHKFGQYVGKFKSAVKAAQAWFGGEGSVGKTGRRDVLGTSVGEYGKKFAMAVKQSTGRAHGTGGAALGAGVGDSAMGEVTEDNMDFTSMDLSPNDLEMDMPSEEMAMETEEDPIEKEETTLGSILGNLDFSGFQPDEDAFAAAMQMSAESKNDIMQMIAAGVEAQTTNAFLPRLPGFGEIAS